MADSKRDRAASAHQATEGEWRECPTGALAGLSARLRRRRGRRSFLKSLGVLAAASLGAASLGYGVVRSRSGGAPNRDFGGLTCAEAVPHAGSLLRGELDEPLRSQVRNHLTQCPLCVPHFRGRVQT